MKTAFLKTTRDAVTITSHANGLNGIYFPVIETVWPFYAAVERAEQYRKDGYQVTQQGEDETPSSEDEDDIPDNVCPHCGMYGVAEGAYCHMIDHF